MPRLRKGVPQGSANAAADAQFELEGFLAVREIRLRLVGTSTATLDWDDVTISVAHNNGRNFGTIQHLSSLNYFVHCENAGFGHSSITNPAGGGAVDALFIIRFGVPGHPVTLGIKPDEELIVELGAVPTFTGTWSCKVREGLGLTPYLVKVRDKTITYTGDDQIELPNNVAAFMLSPATGVGATDPTEISIFQGSTRMDEGSFTELIKDTAADWNWDGAALPTHLFYSFTGGLWEKSRIVDAVQDNVVIECDGGVGSANLTVVTIRPDYELLNASVREVQDIMKNESDRVKTQPSIQPQMKQIISPKAVGDNPGPSTVLPVVSPLKLF